MAFHPKGSSKVVDSYYLPGQQHAQMGFYQSRAFLAEAKLTRLQKRSLPKRQLRRRRSLLALAAAVPPRDQAALAPVCSWAAAAASSPMVASHQWGS
eukprot:3937914-Rhodomonas_salina.3